MIGMRAAQLDYARGRTSVQRLDGRRLSGTVSRVQDLIASVNVDFVSRECLLELDNGQQLSIDFPATVFARPPGHLVYLDQNRWISIAQALHSPERVRPKSEQAPALTLVEAARRRDITLALSSAHLVEQSHASDARRRRDLGEIMVGLSRGWFMRSPLAVRREEVTQALRTRASSPNRGQPRPPVFTCSPRDIFSAPSTPTMFAPERDFAGDPMHGLNMAAQAERLASVVALLATVIDDSPLDTEEGVASAAGWAANHDRLSQYLGRTSRSREQRHIAARAKVLADLGDELPIWAHGSGMTTDEFSDWFKTSSASDLPHMPYMGRVHEVTQLRLANRHDRWEANDLNDLHFLSCATAYADVVVAEKKHGNYLVRVQPNVTPGAHVVTSLRDAVELLSAL